MKLLGLVFEKKGADCVANLTGEIFGGGLAGEGSSEVFVHLKNLNEGKLAGVVLSGDQALGKGTLKSGSKKVGWSLESPEPVGDLGGSACMDGCEDEVSAEGGGKGDGDGGRVAEFADKQNIGAMAQSSPGAGFVGASGRFVNLDLGGKGDLMLHGVFYGKKVKFPLVGMMESGEEGKEGGGFAAAGGSGDGK